MTARGKVIGGGVLTLVLATAVGGAPYVRAIGALADLAGVTGGMRSWIPTRPQPVTTADVDAPTRHGAIAARVYSPAGAAPTLVVFPGIHGGGVDEPRLARFCSRLASTGARVICVPLPDLREFRVTSRSTDMIEDVTAWVAKSPSLAPSGRVALVGVSFAGGLALVAAGRPSLAGRLSAVVSVGGHGDLARTLRYLGSGRLPDGSLRPPHDYGVAVAALAAAPLLLAPPTSQAFSRAVRLYLEASLDESPNRAQGQRLLAEARDAAKVLQPAERRVLLAITDRDVSTAGAWFEPAIPTLAADPGLSPEASPPATAPVFLVHGLDDNVIPAAETRLTAAYLVARGNRRVEWLLTPYVTHVDLSGAFRWGDAWRLVRFWRQLQAAIGA